VRKKPDIFTWIYQVKNSSQGSSGLDYTWLLYNELVYINGRKDVIYLTVNNEDLGARNSTGPHHGTGSGILNGNILFMFNGDG
jgi:hypothetical protein